MHDYDLRAYVDRFRGHTCMTRTYVHDVDRFRGHTCMTMTYVHDVDRFRGHTCMTMTYVQDVDRFRGHTCMTMTYVHTRLLLVPPKKFPFNIFQLRFFSRGSLV